jgi:hypothetical protein
VCWTHPPQHEAEITAILQELSRTPITLALLQVSSAHASHTALWTSASQQRGLRLFALCALCPLFSCG